MDLVWILNFPLQRRSREDDGIPQELIWGREHGEVGAPYPAASRKTDDCQLSPVGGSGGDRYAGLEAGEPRAELNLGQRVHTLLLKG